MTDTPLHILYQDEYLVVVNKPSGMLVHRSWLDKGETRFVMQTLRDQIGQYVYPLHRLDKPTSGVLVFALSSEVASQMMPQFAEGQVKKAYHAIVRGWVSDAGQLDYPLVEEQDKIADKHASQPPTAKPAVTDYQPLATVELPIATGRYMTSRYSLVAMQPHTGRKHQLRRHMHHLSHPIVGDTTHGDGRHNRVFREHFNCHQLLLHASEMTLTHPVSGALINIHAPVDTTWQHILYALGWEAPSSSQ
ncbi:tRNA pseudouridine(65) synthase TruC [Salinivibrio sp. ES.052]|uniref:tRNA pseudouridine(65) synthase TruC n=1 Tax=Salinivibrio sp. ES.052 TaxID=1882823 RepID=UPI000927B266|nr:tRNA pseudouridine(65) synthase TruC [Salinivibrio sp. ES.052]SIO01064.1 tRNA pseudouridine synthase C [Salinivibrio sp. ES.052]